MELHGTPTNEQWTHLEQTASAGSSQIVLSTDVDWQPGNKIVISPTNFEAKETEVRTITGISSTTVTLDSPLTYSHEGSYWLSGYKL